MCGLELVYTPVGLSGAIEAFAFRADGKIVHSHARSASAAVWTPFRPVGDEDGAETRKFASGPTVVRAADGRLEVVARGMDGALYVKYQLAPNGVRGWGPWVRVDGGPAFAGVPSAVLSAEGFLQLFARSASSGEIMYNGQLRNASGVYWSGWQSLGGSFAAGPWAVLDAESLLHVFAVDASGVLQEVEATAPPSGDCSWAGWTSLDGGVATGARVSVVLNGANLLEVYAPRAPPTAPSPSSASRCGAAAASARNPLPASLRTRPRMPPSLPPPGDERLALRRRLADGVDRARRAARARGLAHRARRRALRRPGAVCAHRRRRRRRERAVRAPARRRRHRRRRGAPVGAVARHRRRHRRRRRRRARGGRRRRRRRSDVHVVVLGADGRARHAVGTANASATAAALRATDPPQPPPPRAWGSVGRRAPNEGIRLRPYPC